MAWLPDEALNRSCIPSLASLIDVTTSLHPSIPIIHSIRYLKVIKRTTLTKPSSKCVQCENWMKKESTKYSLFRALLSKLGCTMALNTAHKLYHGAWKPMFLYLEDCALVFQLDYYLGDHVVCETTPPCMFVRNMCWIWCTSNRESYSALVAHPQHAGNCRPRSRYWLLGRVVLVPFVPSTCRCQQKWSKGIDNARSCGKISTSP